MADQTKNIKPIKLDSLRPINERKFFQWKETILSFLKTNKDFHEFLKDDRKWTARNDADNRGEDESTKEIALDTLINHLATYGPEALVHDIVNESDSVNYVFNKIRSMFQLKVSGASILKYAQMKKTFKHAGEESYQDFYYKLRACRYETLNKKDQIVTYKGKTVTANEKMSCAIECGIVIDWLEAIDERLVEYIGRVYSRDLQSITLYDLQETIADNLDELLTEIKNTENLKSYKTGVKEEKEEDPVHTRANRTFDRRSRGGARPKQGQSKQRRNGQPMRTCAICKAANRNHNHATLKCNFLPFDDKKDIARSFLTKVTDCLLYTSPSPRDS